MVSMSIHKFYDRHIFNAYGESADSFKNKIVNGHIKELQEKKLKLLQELNVIENAIKYQKLRLK
jgi:hypothetical protein